MTSSDCRVHLLGTLALLCSGLSFAAQPLEAVYLDLDVSGEPVLDPFSGSYYLLVYAPEGVNWYEARDAAETTTFNGMTGHLATFASADEENFVIGAFPEIETNYVWLGASDETHEDDWRWLTGEPGGHVNWGSGEPNGGSYENCLDYGDGVTRWNDESCFRPIDYYLVEFSTTSPAGGLTERVSLSNVDAESNGSSSLPSISADGRYIAFSSNATNLVLDDNNGVYTYDVFVRDRIARITERVSLASEGAEIPEGVFPREYGISGSGRYVAFTAEAKQVVPEDNNYHVDVFVRDREAGKTELVSIAMDGHSGDFHSTSPAIDGEGRYVAFESGASNLVPKDRNSKTDIFVRDRRNQTTERVSLGKGGVEANGQSADPSISRDGRFVAFLSDADNLVSGDRNAETDVFVRDRRLQTTERISLGGGTQKPQGYPSVEISDDGRYVVYTSTAGDIVPDDTNGIEDVFVFDRVTRTTERASLASDGSQSDGGLGWGSKVSISGDGRYVAFGSGMVNLVPGDSNGRSDVFVRDRVEGITERVSVATDGSQTEPGGGSSGFPAISDDGRFIAFMGQADNLVSDDTNERMDVFVRQRFLPMVESVLIDVRPGTALNAVSPDYGLIPVAVLSTSVSLGEPMDFSALEANPRTARLGPDEAMVLLSSRNVRAVDVDNDGDPDLVLQFRASETGIRCGDSEVELRIASYGGIEMTGVGEIRTVLCQPLPGKFGVESRR